MILTYYCCYYTLASVIKLFSMYLLVEVNVNISIIIFISKKQVPGTVIDNPVYDRPYDSPRMFQVGPTTLRGCSKSALRLYPDV